MLEWHFIPQVVPQCPKCSGQIPPQSTSEDDDDQEEVLTVMKPDIVFFGEGLPDVFHHTLDQDKLSVCNTCTRAHIHTLFCCFFVG